jgi:hypothetical protein
VDNVAEFFEPHQVVYLDGFRLADTVHVVSGKIDQHNMLGPVFFGGKEGSAQFLVL